MLPHIFTEAELRVEFSDFEILDLDPRDQGRVLTDLGQEAFQRVIKQLNPPIEP